MDKGKMMACKRLRTNDLKAMAEKELQHYDEVMFERLIDIAKDELSGMEVSDVDEDFWMGIFHSWTTDDPDEWAFKQVQEGYEDACENAYDEAREEALIEGK